MKTIVISKLCAGFALFAGLLLVSNMRLMAQDLNPLDWPSMKGYWKFQDTADLTKATVGNDLILIGIHQSIQGPNYGDLASRIGIGSFYKSYHQIAPNGGGDSVNRYSLMFDFRVMNFDRWHTFFQTDSTNMNDGECFIEPQDSILMKSTFGTATTGYSPDSIEAMQWYRMVISVCLDSFYRYYINGNLWLEGDTQYVDDRFALTPLILFFADNNQEDDTIDIASLAIFDNFLTPGQVAKLGGLDPCIANPPEIELGPDTMICSDNSLVLNAGIGFKSYLWSTGDTVQYILLDSNSWGSGSQNVWVKAYDMNSCEAVDTVMITFSNCSSLSHYILGSNVKIFPNPVLDYLNIEFVGGAFFAQLYNLNGQKISSINYSETSSYRFDMKDFSSGVYYLKVGNNKTEKIIKIVKF